MMPTEQHPGLNALEQELEALKSVHSALEAEYSALVESSAERLETAILDKNRSLETLVSTRAQRESLLAAHDVRAHIRDRLPLDADAQAAALAVVDSIQTIGNDCQAINARNGQLIGGLREMTEGALTVLRGEPVVSLYGQSGDRASNLGSRSLGTA